MGHGETVKRERAPRNRTLDVSASETARLRKQIVDGSAIAGRFRADDAVILGDAFAVLPRLPKAGYSLLFADPPYNLS
ncbi:MAG: hypothetical protein QUS14_10420, partial [Pyrinomonadaceae bacterium]|nr:hypothetical protein [Pyrinomonadaceae bacterium]